MFSILAIRGLKLVALGNGISLNFAYQDHTRHLELRFISSRRFSLRMSQSEMHGWMYPTRPLTAEGSPMLNQYRCRLLGV